jgi:diguanylate cyclase (GGDEF)-like protein
MKSSSDRDERAAINAASELGRLHEQAVHARAALARLRRDIAEAEGRLGRSRAAQLLEANEQLVLAVLRAKTEAETATMALDAASRSAEFDALTELPNRVLLLDRFAQAIANAKRRGSRVALLFLDLNNFKQINDTLGHAVGDDVLKAAAHCLASAVRDADTVSRHGGDEFVVLLADVAHARDALLIADKLIAALGVPSRVGDHVLRLTASIGISVYPDDGEAADALIAEADAAMYHAKRLGLGRFYAGGSEGKNGLPLEAAALPCLLRPLTHVETAEAEHERRRAHMQEANEQLVLAALSAQTLQSAAELALRRQTEILAVVAHELRNPLTPIRTAAALLGRVKADELPRLQGIIERQVQRVTRLASDLLDVSRANTGKLRLERRRVDLTSVVDEAVDACRPAMDMRLQHLCVHLPVRTLEVDGDPVRLVQVLCNLLDNASKYTPNGGEIGISVVLTGENAVITVVDHGIGMTPQALLEVFEPFVQEAHAIDFNASGLGIGLTVVRELVEAHGGSVVASSAGSGLGSCFVVTLPLAGTPGSALKVPSP